MYLGGNFLIRQFSVSPGADDGDMIALFLLHVPVSVCVGPAFAFCFCMGPAFANGLFARYPR